MDRGGKDHGDRKRAMKKDWMDEDDLLDHTEVDLRNKLRRSGEGKMQQVRFNQREEGWRGAHGGRPQEQQPRRFEGRGFGHREENFFQRDGDRDWRNEADRREHGALTHKKVFGADRRVDIDSRSREKGKAAENQKDLRCFRCQDYGHH